MASSSDDDSEKSHEPTQKRLQDARKKGEIARSADLNGAIAYSGFWLALLAFGAQIVLDVGAALRGYLANAPDLSRQFLSGPAHLGIGRILADTIFPLLSLFLIPALAVVLTIFAQQAFLFTPSKIAPKLNRVSPVQNAKNKFGRAGLFEFAKNLIKLLVFAICLGVYLRSHLPDHLVALRMEAGQIVILMGHTITGLFGVIVCVALAIAAADYLWQRTEFLRRNRMSHKDLRDEMKDAEGDPHVKAQRRAKAQQIALSGNLSDVPEASVVIVNPTHYAVALRYDAGVHGAPVCVAKGVDDAALRIREIAAEAGVPIHHDAPTARALHATLEVGDQVNEDLFAPVAVAIRFAEDMRQKARFRA